MPKTYHYIKRGLSAFASSTNLVRKIKNILGNFKRVAWQCFALLKIFVLILNRSILSLNFNQFHETSLSNSLSAVNVTCVFFKFKYMFRNYGFVFVNYC